MWGCHGAAYRLNSHLQRCIWEEGAHGRKSCDACYMAKKKCFWPTTSTQPGPSEAGPLSALVLVVGPSRGGTLRSQPIMEVPTLIAGGKHQQSQLSLEVLHDIANVVHGLGANEQYDKLDAHIKALKSQVAALTIALEEEMVKKGSEKESDDDSDEETEMDEDEQGCFLFFVKIFCLSSFCFFFL